MVDKLMIAKGAQAVCSIGAAGLTVYVGAMERRQDQKRMKEEIAKQVSIQMEKNKSHK